LRVVGTTGAPVEFESGGERLRTATTEPCTTEGRLGPWAQPAPCGTPIRFVSRPGTPAAVQVEKGAVGAGRPDDWVFNVTLMLAPRSVNLSDGGTNAWIAGSGARLGFHCASTGEGLLGQAPPRSFRR